MDEDEKPLKEWTDSELRKEIMKIEKSMGPKLMACETKEQIREIWDLESRMADLQQERERRYMEST